MSKESGSFSILPQCSADLKVEHAFMYWISAYEVHERKHHAFVLRVR